MLNSPVPEFLNMSALVLRKVHQHHRVGHRGLRNVDPRLGDDGRMVRAGAFFLGRRRKHGVARIFDVSLGSLVDLMFLQAVGVAPKLLLDPVGGAVEGHLGGPRAV